jgi:hypothetical protein
MPDAMPQDVRKPADLYAVRPEQFTGARQALVKALRQAGDTRAAAEAAAMKRPTLPLWAVNQLARHDRAAVSELIGAAERLQAAQLGQGGDQRAAAAGYQAVLKRCEDQAIALLPEAGAGLTGDARNRLSRTLAAAAADPELRPALQEGRLPAEATATGFEVFDGLSAAPRDRLPQTDEAPPRPTPAPRATRKPDPEHHRRVMRARTALADAKAALERAQAQAARSTRTADDAQQRADEAKRAAERAQAEADRAKTEAEAASRRVAVAEQERHAAESAARP